MKKLKLSDLHDMGISYFKADRIRVTTADNTVLYATRVTVDNPLTSLQQQLLLGHGNITTTECHYRYAPEIVHDVIIIFDKNRRSF